MSNYRLNRLICPHGHGMQRVIRRTEHIKGFYSELEKFRVTFTANGKRKFECATWPTVPLTCANFYPKVSSFEYFLYKNCFGLLLVAHFFYFKNFSTWIWRLPFAVSITLKLSVIATCNGTRVPLVCHVLVVTAFKLQWCFVRSHVTLTKISQSFWGAQKFDF